MLGLAASLVLAIVAVTLTPSWSPLPRGPVPASPSAGVKDRLAQERQVVVRTAPKAGAEGPVTAGAPPPPPLGGAPSPTSEPEQPSRPTAEPGVVVATPTQPRRRPPAPEGNSPPLAEPSPSPIPSSPPVEAVPPPAPPSPPAPEAVVSTHPGQGNAYGKEEGNGPPGGVPPGQVGR